MSADAKDPVLHLLAGCNGAGKTTLYETVLGPITNLPFINADVIAKEKWPGAEAEHSYQAAEIANSLRRARITKRSSFIAETVFSHESKLQLVEEAASAGFLITLHCVVIPENLAVARVANRVDNGGHFVPEGKIRQRYQRLWSLVAKAIDDVHEAVLYDNSSARVPYKPVARFQGGACIEISVPLPSWLPAQLKDLIDNRF